MHSFRSMFVLYMCPRVNVSVLLTIRHFTSANSPIQYRRRLIKQIANHLSIRLLVYLCVLFVYFVVLDKNRLTNRHFFKVR